MSEICETLRPMWDGTPPSALSELVTLAAAPPSLILIAATALTFRFRNQWAALAVVVLWSFYTGFLTIIDPGAVLAAGRAAGCLGSPALFIAAVAAICVAIILYTAPNESQKS
jgi:hypothetical protein